jgi:hypothetical protein
MPHVVSHGEPSLWQKLKGEQATYRSATVWKLIAYGDAPAPADPAAHSPAIAQASSDSASPKDIGANATEAGANKEPSTKKKG